MLDCTDCQHLDNLRPNRLERVSRLLIVLPQRTGGRLISCMRPLQLPVLFLTCGSFFAAQSCPALIGSSIDESRRHTLVGNTRPEARAANDPGAVAADLPEECGTSNDRLFYTLPNFLTLENAGPLPPLTTGEKFKVVARSSFDYVEYPWYGLLAGISHAENSEAGYGQGAGGYAKRYGAFLADGTVENFVTGAVLPSLLRQDPRFYQSSNGRFLQRLGYAVSRIFITRTDSGGEQFNYSEIFGSAISAGISTYSYHPHADRTLPNTASVWGTQVGYDTVTIVVREFWPDIRRKISHKPQLNAINP